MKPLVYSLFALASAALFSGCDDPQGLSADDEFAPADDGLGGEEAALANPNATYFTVRMDTRRCAAPACGGVWVSRVNHANTNCIDGTQASECYSAKMDLTHLTLGTGDEAAINDAMGQGILLARGHIAHYRRQGVDYGKFVVTEAWFGGTGTPPAGSFFRENYNGISCLVYPCNNIDEGRLNTSVLDTIADFDFTPSGATQNQISVALQATYDPEGLMIAGKPMTVSGAGGTAPARSVYEFYTLFAD